MRGCIKLFRREVEWEKKLNDPELRLYLLHRRIADWDATHARFGTFKISYRKLLAEYLPSSGWSVAKISTTTNALIRKGLISKIGDGSIRVENMLVFQRANVSAAEQLFPFIEQGVRPTEHDVQRAKQRDIRYLEHALRDLAKSKRISSHNVPPAEQPPP